MQLARMQQKFTLKDLKNRLVHITLLSVCYCACLLQLTSLLLTAVCKLGMIQSCTCVNIDDNH